MKDQSCLLRNAKSLTPRDRAVLETRKLAQSMPDRHSALTIDFRKVIVPSRT